MRSPFSIGSISGGLVAALLAGGTAAAHEFWLAPTTYRPALKDTVAVGAFVGTGFRGEARPFAAPRAIRFTMLGPRSIDLAPAAANGDFLWARYIPSDDGGQLLAYESNFVTLELPAERFDAYLVAEGLDGPLAARRALGSKAGPGRERYARCAKAWIAGNDPGRACVARGLALEIVPLADPVGATRLTVEVVYRGAPLPNALVRTWNRALKSDARPFDAVMRDSVGLCEQRRSGPDGRATLDVQRPGEWLINVVHMVPSEDRQLADWQSLWASFTFVRE